MYNDAKVRILTLFFLWTCGQICQVTTQTSTTQSTGSPARQNQSTGSPVRPKCSSNDECSESAPICCGKPGYNRCRASRDSCIGVPCSSSFECDEGRMWCCSHKCKNSACLLPVWAIVLIALAVAIIVTLLLIYVILECCRRWPNLRRTIC